VREKEYGKETKRQQKSKSIGINMEGELRCLEAKHVKKELWTSTTARPTGKTKKESKRVRQGFSVHRQ